MEKLKDECGSRIAPSIDVQITAEHEWDLDALVLKRAYICRRALGNIPFMFDLLAHSAQLFDAYTPEQADQLNDASPPKVRPVTRFMFERLEDTEDPDTQKLRPHIVIREVDIGRPYLLWYQRPQPNPTSNQLSASWYQFDKRAYECFDLDGYYWTKQIRGKAVNTTVKELIEVTEMLIRDPYDVGRHTCHDARDLVMGALGVEKGPLRAFTRLTDSLRPAVSSVKGGSDGLSKS